ncbi:transcriptional regulator [Blastococcus sp. TF02-8]|uniref:RrF2 family transcriptional regulator n=1 Tax=Blastococcus sp. TF02-8 TaxID=2250574 RepID=UPI000DE82E49|nr:Rrf2 family transcriptional regulator [Blastococcus sp. TF02-8]RBY97118.1 transcriptional regulator [Blastococcus sp. TF02-8]
MKVSARADYALRACIELVRAGGQATSSEAISAAQDIPHSFLQNILGDLRRAGFVRANSRAGGGYRLAVPADRVTVADVVRALDGPLVCVHGVDPGELRYPDAAEPLGALWMAVRANVGAVLDDLTLLDLAAGRPRAPEPTVLTG